MSVKKYLDKILVENVTLDAFTKSYIIAALWSSIDDDGEPLDKNYNISDIDPASLRKIETDCAKFQKDNSELYEKGGWNDEQAGHDFWLTRNRHGAGFWDRSYDGISFSGNKLDKEIGKKLTDISHKYGESNLYVGDDKKLHIG